MTLDSQSKFLISFRHYHITRTASRHSCLSRIWVTIAELLIITPMNKYQTCLDSSPTEPSYDQSSVNHIYANLCGESDEDDSEDLDEQISHP